MMNGMIETWRENREWSGSVVAEETARILRTTSRQISRSRQQVEAARVSLAETQAKILESQRTLARVGDLIQALRRELEF